MAKKSVGSAVKQKGKNRRRGRDLVRLAAQLSGRSESMVYQVLGGRATSSVVTEAIEKARMLLRRGRSAA
jgi:hypothetical protein